MDIFDCIIVSGHDLILAIPSQGLGWEEEIESVRNWWGGPLWVIWPSEGERRTLEYLGRRGQVLLKETVSPLYKGPYTPEETVQAGKAILECRSQRKWRKVA